MTERLPYVQLNRKVSEGTGHSAQEWRWLNAGAATSGVCGAGDLKIAPATGMQVTAAAGGVFVPDGATPAGGLYHCYNDGPVTLTVGASSPTLNRLDRIIAEVLDTSFGGSGDLWRLRVMAGTATSGTATAPTTPARALSLATIDVPAAASSITAARITDGRILNAAWGNARGVVWSGSISGSMASAGSEKFFTVQAPTLPGRAYVMTCASRVMADTAGSAGEIRAWWAGANMGVFWVQGNLAPNSHIAANGIIGPFVATATSHQARWSIVKTVGNGTVTMEIGSPGPTGMVLDVGGVLL